MKRILLCGCCGKMGRVITRLVGERDDCLIVAGVDLQEDRETGAFPVYSSVDHVEETVDVIIDFSHPSLLSSLLAYAKEHRVPIVLCTTGYTAEQVEDLKEASQQTAVFYSLNMSIGINLLIDLTISAKFKLSSRYNANSVSNLVLLTYSFLLKSDLYFSNCLSNEAWNFLSIRSAILFAEKETTPMILPPIPPALTIAAAAI